MKREKQHLAKFINEELNMQLDTEMFYDQDEEYNEYLQWQEQQKQEAEPIEEDFNIFDSFLDDDPDYSFDESWEDILNNYNWGDIKTN